MTDEEVVSLRDHIEARLIEVDRTVARGVAEIERSVAREVAVLRTLMGEHASAHAREHEMANLATLTAHKNAELQLTLMQTATKAMFDQMQREMDKTSETMTDKFDKVNEFRKALSDLSAEMARSETVMQLRDTIEKAMDDLTTQMRDADEKNRVKTEVLEKEARFTEGRILGISLTVGAVVTIITLLLRFLPFG